MTRTIALSGAEVKLDGLGGTYANVLNSGVDVVYASASPNIVAGADGVTPITAGGSVIVECNGTVYLLGTGSVTAVGSSEPIYFFKTSAAASGEGGGVDELARKAINTHAGSADIHLTAEDAVEAAATAISNPNLIINPYFKNPINQRGLTTYSGGGYTIDCWRLGNNYTTAEITADGIKIGYADGATDVPAIFTTRIENYADFAGKTVTASVNIAESTSAKTQMMVTYTADGARKYHSVPTASAGVHNITVQIPDNITDLELWLYGADIRNGDTVDSCAVFEWAKIEIGSVATPFIPPDPATELAKCQRYYQIRTTGDIDPIDLRPSMNTITDIKERSDGNYEYIAEL